MSLDSKVRLFSVQSAYGHTGIAVISPPGTETVITDNFEGMPLGRPNDLIVDKKGGVYFTDPGLNGAQAEAVKRALAGKPLPPRLPPAVYYVPAGGKAIKVADTIETPNGITLSRDEKMLFLNNTNGLYMLAFDINPDGTLRNRRNFAVYEGRSKRPNDLPGIVTGADGLIIDSEGRLYALTAALRSSVPRVNNSASSTCLATIKIARALPSVVRRKARYMSPVVAQSGKLRCFRPDSKAGRSRRL